MMANKKDNKPLLWLGVGIAAVLLLRPKKVKYRNIDKHFSEAIVNRSANHQNKQITPTAEQLANADYLAEHFLNPLFEELKILGLENDLLINSWLRSPATNSAVGGVAGSDHLDGNGLDLDLIINGIQENNKLVALIVALNLPFTKLGLEFGVIREPGHIHITVRKADPNKRIVFRLPSDGRSYDYAWLKRTFV